MHMEYGEARFSMSRNSEAQNHEAQGEEGWRKQEERGGAAAACTPAKRSRTMDG